MTTRSLRALVEGLSNKHSTLITLKPLASPDLGFSLRFSDLSEKQTFLLALCRHWKSTEINLRADAFASKTLTFLATQAVERKIQIKNLIDEKRSSYSTCQIMVDGKSFLDDQLSEPYSTFEFQASILTEDSSIENGLVGEKEAVFVSFCIEIFSLILPLSDSRYTNPDEVTGFPEGSVSHVVVNKYERDPRNRRIAIELHGTKCMACDFDFEAKYGPLGREYIVIHHTTPVSSMGEGYIVDPATDLVAICANCHAMVHRVNPPMPILELRKLLQGPKSE